jgi:hypothetical protein
LVTQTERLWSSLFIWRPKLSTQVWFTQVPSGVMAAVSFLILGSWPLLACTLHSYDSLNLGNSANIHVLAFHLFLGQVMPFFFTSKICIFEHFPLLSPISNLQVLWPAFLFPFYWDWGKSFNLFITQLASVSWHGLDPLGSNDRDLVWCLQEGLLDIIQVPCGTVAHTNHSLLPYCIETRIW